jgi:hypothetical protein
MPNKHQDFFIQGMVRDNSEHVFDPKYAYENHNIRIIANPNSDSTHTSDLLAMTNEKGNRYTYINGLDDGNMIGVPIGQCLINKQWVVFMTDRPSGTTDEEIRSCKNRIYRLWIENSEMQGELLYEGYLNFDYRYPLETLPYYENEQIQKVYWTDGINQPRFINIVEKEEKKSLWNDKSFDFTPEINLLNHEVSITERQKGGKFPAGVIQWCFTYSRQFGQETAIFESTDLYELKFPDRGAAPDEQTSQSFEINLTGLDDSFDFINIYSIIRTSLDGVPNVKCIANLPIVNGSARFIDNNLYGYAVDPQELLYKGSEIITAYTMEQKNNTLFLGNYSLKRSYIPQDLRDSIKNIVEDSFSYVENEEFNTPHFRNSNTYRFALQFQHKSGKWSEAVYVGDKVCNTPFSYGNANFDGNMDLKQQLIDLGYVRVRPLVVYPNMAERRIVAQGVLSNTICMSSDTNKLYPDYFFRLISNYSWGTNQNSMNSAYRWWYNKLCWTPIGSVGSPDIFRNEYSVNETNVSNDNRNVPELNEDWWSFYSPDVNFNDSYQTDINDSQMILNGYISYLNNTVLDTEITTTSISKPTEGKRRWWKNSDGVMSRISEFYSFVDSLTQQNYVEEYVDNDDVNDDGESSEQSVEKRRYRFKSYGTNEKWDFVKCTSDNKEYFDSALLYPNRIPSSFKPKKVDNRHYVGGFLWEDTFMNISKEHIDTLDKDIPTRSGGFMQYYGQWIFPVMLWQASGSINYDPDNKPSSVLKSNKVLHRFDANVVKREPIFMGNVVCKSANGLNTIKLESVDNDTTLYSNRVDNIILWDEYYSSLLYIHPSPNKIAYNDSFQWKDLETKRYTYNNRGTQWALNQGYIEKISDTIPYDDKKRESHDDESGFAWHNLGDNTHRVRSADMKYTTVPNYVIKINKDDIGSILSMNGMPSSLIPIVSIYQPINTLSIFGGNTEATLQTNNFLIAGKPVNIADEYDAPVNNVEIWWSVGDTYYQDYEILKTYPLTFEAENCVTEVLNVKLETYWNMDCRYDTWKDNPTFATSPANWNLMNPVYNQKNNFFVYHGLDLSTNSVNNFPNSFTWTLTKWAGDLTDKWTHITMATSMDVDGSKGNITKIIKLQDNLLCFQPRGMSQILYNEREQIATGSGVPIELANSGKVSGVRYITEQTGCNNKWSICKTESGLYWVDDENKAIMAWNQQLANLSDSLGFHSWINDKSTLDIWNPLDFKSFVTYYDPYYESVMFFYKDNMLSYNTQLNCFDSFFSYGYVPYYEAFEDTAFTLSDKDSQHTDSYKVWEQHKGNYNYFYVHDNCIYDGDIIKCMGRYDKDGMPTNYGYEPYWTTLLVNSDTLYDKVFNNFDMRTDMWDVNGNLLEETFSHVEVWNEFQHNKSRLIRQVDIPKIHLPAQHSILKKKFRVWYANIPRDVKTQNSRYYNRDRMRNTWLYLKLSKELIDDDKALDFPYISDNKHIIHHIGVSYFV